MTRVAATILLLLSTVCFADPVADGVTWLLSQRAPDGSFGSGTGEQKVLATAEALQTLRAVGQGDTLAAHYAELYLAISPRVPDAEVELRRELALATTGQQLPLGASTAHAAGFERADPLHLALTLQADIAAGRAGTGASFLAMLDLKARLQASGCWRWADNDDSIQLTAQSVRTLRALLDVPTPGLASNGHINFALQEGARCLRSTSGSGSLGATAMALEALLVAPGANATQIQDARSVLQLAQAADGSIGGSVRVTAIAVRGLLAGAPDWRITPDDFNRPVLAFQDPSPLAGTPAVARLDVENRSGSPAPATTVRFFVKPIGGGAELVGAEVPLQALAPGQVVAVVAQIPTTLLQGQYSVRAVVDPTNAVPEISENNNEASATVNVRAEADLAITSTSITFATTGPAQTRVDVTVRNLGIPLAQAVSVGVWKGNPATGGVRLGGALVPSGLATNGTSTVSVLWASSSVNGPTVVTAVVDEFNVVSEADESNNSAFRFYFPGTANPVDLSISDPDLSVSPTAPRKGEVLTIRAVIRNLSAFDASRVPVVLTSGGGPVLAQLELPFVPANGSAVASFSLVPTTSSMIARVTIDPLQLLNDSNRANNQSFGLVFIIDESAEAEFDMYTFAESAGSVVTASVRNFGTKTQQTTVVVTDLTHGTVLGSRPVTLVRGTMVALDFPFTPGLKAVLRACLDPTNTFVEPNEGNNCREWTLSGNQNTELYVQPADIGFTPVGADVGEKVHIRAKIHNKSAGNLAVDATAVVEWWHGLPSRTGSRLVGSTPVAVGANAIATAEFDWVRADGPVEVCARITQIFPRDTNDVSNLSCRHLFLEQVVNLDPTTFLQAGAQVRIARLTGQADPELLYLYQNWNGQQTANGLAVMRRDSTGKYVELWRAAMPDADRIPTDLVVADLDNDNAAEAVIFVGTVTAHGLAPRSEVRVYRADGSLKWTQGFAPAVSQWGNHFVEGVGGQLAIGDVNGDGIADVVTVEALVRVFSGDDGHLLWTAPTPTVGLIPGNCHAVVLDVDGNGSNEVFVNCGDAFLLSSSGAQQWTTVGNCAQPVGIADLDLDGSPEGIRNCGGRLVALDLRNGAIKATSPGSVRVWEYAVAPVGPALQDGLPYLFASDNSTNTVSVGFYPGLSLLWQQSVARPDNFDVYVGTLVDLLGLGRPQFVANSPNRPLMIQDSRNGKLMMEIPVAGFGGQPGANFTYSNDIPPVASGRGSGDTAVLIGQMGYSGDVYLNGVPHYGAGEVLIMSSPHWKKQPSVWPTRVLRKGQVDESTLKVSTDYRWWTSHNTWNQQFDVEPGKLLPDLTVALAASPAPGTAGAASTLTATVKNLGGLSASGVVVAFFDGDPNQGGKPLGTAIAAGPIAVRGGTGTASISWVAYPEGDHTLFAIANPAKAVEEPDYDNNTSQLRYFVEPGTDLCDAAVDGSSLAVVPSQPLAGQSMQLSATVRNLGPIGCPAQSLTVRDGAAGPLIGTASVPSLAPGAQSVVSLIATAAPGMHLLRFIADEAATLQDRNTDNNIATLVLDVPAATQADYLVSSVSFSPNPARAGETVTGTAVVQNQGATATVLTSLLAMASSTTLASITVNALAAGETQTLTFSFAAPAVSVAVEVRADSYGALAEFDETNNLRVAPLAIETTALSLSGSVTPAAAAPGTTVNLNVAAQLAPPNALETFFDVQLIGPTGVAVASVASGQREVLAPGTTTLSFSVNPSNLAPGGYVFHVVARSAGRVAAVLDVPLTVLPETSALTVLLVDRASYHPGEDAVLTQRTTNLSRNAALAGASLTVRVLSPSAAVLSSTTRQLASLSTGAFVDTIDLFAVSANLPPGNYTADSTVRDSSGLALAVTTAAFTVVYQPQETVRGALSAASPFPIGPALSVAIQLSNDGALALVNGTLELSLVNATTLAVESLASAAVSVGAGGSSSATLSLPTTSIPEGQKLLVARLAGRTLDKLLLLAIRNLDVDPPVILVTGIDEGDFANHDVAPLVTVQDQSAFTTSFTLDGLPFASGDVVSAEGPHVLSLVATDSWGNSAQRVLHFTIDKTGPVLTLSGPADGALLVGPATLGFSASDDNLGAVTATLDSSSFPNGGTVSADGTYVWVVTAVDSAGNTTTQIRTFTLDSTPPVITIAGVSDGDLLNHSVTISFSAADAHPGSLTATLDGAPFFSGSTVANEGTHVLSVSATDLLGNSSTRTLTFVLDLTPPVITVAGVTAGTVTNVPVTLTFSAPGASTVGATLDAAPFSSGDTVSTEGDHLLVVTATDLAGNTATLSVAFALDFVAPIIAVSGVASGQLRNAPATIIFGSTDAHPGTTAASVDGASFASGSTVSAAGDHLLVVTAIDAAGNVATQSIPFSIDLTAPVIAVSGVTPGALGNSAVTITFSSTDAHPGTTSATLDGTRFSSGDAVSAEGDHLLVVTATDLAGNTAAQSVPFALDLTAPLISISGVGSGELRNTAATINFSATDAHPGTVGATLDGAGFTSGSTVAGAGDHLLVVTATDAAGNTATRSIPFSLDLEAPVITITGITDGALQNAFATISFSASDAHPGPLSATVDGTVFSSGSTVASEGVHSLVVTATDAAGNTASRSLSFTLDFAAPVLTVSGVTSGALRNAPVLVSFSSTDLNPGTFSATLDGAPFVSGGTVGGEGDHLLVVTATDGAGNTASLSVPFSLDFTLPVIQLTGVAEGASGTSFTPVFSATDAHSVVVSAALDGAALSSGTTVTSAGAHTLVVNATDGAGNAATQTVHFTITGAPTGRPTFDFAVCAFGGLTVQNNALVRGAQGGAGSVGANGAFLLKNNARIGGAVVSGAGASLMNNSLVDGRVWHGGAFSQANNALAAGGHQSVSPVPEPCGCGFDLSAALAEAAASNDNHLLAGNPALVNGGLSVKNNSTLTLAAGRYFLTAVEVKNNARLTAAPGAQVELFVLGSVVVENNGTLGGHVGSAPILVVSGATGPGEVEIKNNADATLLLYAPLAPVILSNNATIFGAVTGKDVTLSNNQVISLAGFSQSAPPPLTCPRGTP